MPQEAPLTSSPVPAGTTDKLTIKGKMTKNDLLDFPQAIAAIMDKQKVTRVEWNNPAIYGYLDGGRLRIMLENGKHDWLVVEGDMFATDWKVV